MSNRFKDLKPKKENMFRKNKSKTPNLKQNNRWSRLESEKPKKSFVKSSQIPEIPNSRWSNLKSSDTDNGFQNKTNHFKRDQNKNFNNNHRKNYKNNYRNNRRRNSVQPSIFANATMVNGVPQIKGALQRSFNIMDSIAIKSKEKKKSPKKKSKKNQNLNIEKNRKETKETEEEKKQKELWKQQLLAQYAYESFSEEEDDDEL